MRRLKNVARRLVGRPPVPPPPEPITFTGDYTSWDEAARVCSGYDAGPILEKTRQALLKVKRGEAVYERDSVLFDQVQHSFPLLAGLLRAAVADAGRLCVLDFGGSLGSSYFQCRDFLRVASSLEWLVVEQAAHVACGRRDFASEQLHFHESAAEAARLHRPNVLLISSVLPYLPDPYGTLQELLRLSIPHFILDRTGFLPSGRDRLTVQKVPAWIYEASYPAWFFDEKRLTGTVQSAGYDLVAEFPAFDTLSPVDEPALYKGFIFERARGR